MKNKNNTILNLNEHIKILKDQKIYLLKEIDKFSKIIIKTILKGGKILIIGNGVVLRMRSILRLNLQ